MEGSCTLFDASGRRLGAYRDTWLVMPGSYTVDISDGPKIEDVVVEAGQVTFVK